MALVIPTSRSTFGDATTVAGGPLSPYILAQLPDDADLGWLMDIRRMAAVDEVKWKVFQVRREAIQAKKDLWARILRGMRAATVVIIKPDDVAMGIQAWLEKEGAEEGCDYSRDNIIEVCSTELVADTPVAYLPNRLSQLHGLYEQDLFLSFDKFVPERILSRLGGKLRDAKVFAARAHAVFDSEHLTQMGGRTSDAFRPAGRTVVLQELLSTPRGFDMEHPKSIEVLNEAADTIAASLTNAILLPGTLSEGPLVREYDSRDVDQIQAADIACGWAHELIALGNERALLATFGRVIVNGALLQ